MMASQTEIRGENKNFKEVCSLVCPGYKQKGRNLTEIAYNFRMGDFNFGLFSKQINRFLKIKNKVKEIIDSEIPNYPDYIVKNGNLKYKRDASSFLEKLGIKIPASSLVPVRFYYYLIKGLLDKGNVRVVRLEDRLLEELDILKESADRDVVCPPDFKGNQDIEYAYKYIRKYIRKTSSRKK